MNPPTSVSTDKSSRSRSDRRNQASSSWQHPAGRDQSGFTPTLPLAPDSFVSSPTVNSNSNDTTDSQATIAYDDESDSDATVNEFSGFQLYDVQIPFSEPDVPAFWDSSHSLSYLMNSHPLKRSDDDFIPGPYSQELQFELPSELGCFLVNFVCIPDGSVLVYSITEAGSTTAVIEKALDALTTAEIAKHFP